MESVGIVLNGVGGLAIGWMALSVHRVVGRERRIDQEVIGLMQRERIIGYIGLALITAGTAIQLVAW